MVDEDSGPVGFLVFACVRLRLRVRVCALACVREFVNFFVKPL
jgi:hypothetical protein